MAFKQIWPDQGDWNLWPQYYNIHDFDLNKFDPIKGIETSQSSRVTLAAIADLNKFDLIKGIETKELSHKP